MKSMRVVTRARMGARLALAATLVLLTLSLVRAAGDEPTLDSSQDLAGISRSDSQRRIDAAAPDLARLVARDPFSPLRTAPDVPYRIGAASTDSIFMRSAAPVRLLGTIVGGTGRSFAMCLIEGEPARVVYPGERIGGMTLERVSQGSAVFIDEAGARVVLRVPRTGE